MSGVNIVTIMTAKTLSVGVLLTIVPRLTIKFDNQLLPCFNEIGNLWFKKKDGSYHQLLTHESGN